MQLDDLKEAWAAHGALLERGVAIQERLLREMELRKVRHAMAPYALWRGLEAGLGIALLVVVMPVLAAHIFEPRYLVAGGSVALLAAGIAAVSMYLLVNGLKLDFAGPVMAIQREIERLRLVEYGAMKWAVLGGVVVWLPAALILFEASTGIDALGRANVAWLIMNLVFGLVVLVLGQALSRRYVERPGLGPWARRIMDAVSGKSLRTAARHLAELSKFEREEA